MESGTRKIQIEEIISISKIFDVSIEGILAGEFKTKKNVKKIQKNFLEYLKMQSSYIKKVKLFSFLLILLLVTSFIGFSIYYFLNNYNTIKVYKFSGVSENYRMEEGLFLLSKDKIYFKIGLIHPKVDRISIFSEIGNEKKLVYEGEPDIILNDIYGYQTYISYDDFMKSKQNLYLKIKEEEIKLNFVEIFRNDGIHYDEVSIIGEDNNTFSKPVPKKVRELFIHKDGYYHLETKKEFMTYVNNVFSVHYDNTYYSYDLLNNLLTYDDLNNVMLFEVDNDKAICKSDNCKESSKIFEHFYKNYILKYIK